MRSPQKGVNKTLRAIVAAKRNACVGCAALMRLFRCPVRSALVLLRQYASMYAVLGSLVDVLHALFMIAWVLGMPLLFWHPWPKLTKAYAAYALLFVVLNQVSKVMLDECFLTTIARYLWEAGAPPGQKPVDEWFTVRFAKAVFHLTPSHRLVTIAGQVLVVLTALGILRSAQHFKRPEPARSDVSDRQM